MTPEEERWAEALAVLRVHGDQAFAHVAARVRDLSAAAGDLAGAWRWIEIAGKLDQIYDAEERPQ